MLSLPFPCSTIDKQSRSTAPVARTTKTQQYATTSKRSTDAAIVSPATRLSPVTISSRVSRAVRTYSRFGPTRTVGHARQLATIGTHPILLSPRRRNSMGRTVNTFRARSIKSMSHVEVDIKARMAGRSLVFTCPLLSERP
jgi:hypothetical protein